MQLGGCQDCCDSAGFSSSCVSGFLTLTFSWPALAFNADRKAGGIDTINCIINVKLSLAGRDFLQPWDNRVELDDPHSTFLMSASDVHLPAPTGGKYVMLMKGGREGGLGGIEGDLLQNRVDPDRL